MRSGSTSEPASQPLPRNVEVSPERLAGWLDRFHGRHGDLTTRPCGEDALVVTAASGAVAEIRLPWPFGGTEVAELVAQALRDRVVGLLLVRRGGFAMGVAEGAVLVDSKVGRRHVQGRTKAGGWSQQRYARRREAQARTAFAAAADTAAVILLPRLRSLDGLVTGGDRPAVTAVLADPRLRRLDRVPQGRFLDVPDPRRRVLEDAVRRSRAVRIAVSDPPRDA